LNKNEKKVIQHLLNRQKANRKPAYQAVPSDLSIKRNYRFKSYFRLAENTLPFAAATKPLAAIFGTAMQQGIKQTN
jgi:hypothetical protein